VNNSFVELARSQLARNPKSSLETSNHRRAPKRIEKVYLSLENGKREVT
jgi:hypothetical protein